MAKPRRSVRFRRKPQDQESQFRVVDPTSLTEGPDDQREETDQPVSQSS